MAEYIKQPNGKYCVMEFGKIKDIDLTEEVIIEIAIKNAKITTKALIEKAENYGKIISNLALQRNIDIPHETLKKIGFTESYNELKKYVPLRPLSQQYAPCDFATYGKCPSCGKTVQDGMGFKQEKCDCGQRLDWGD